MTGKRLRKNGLVHGEDVERRLDDSVEFVRELLAERIDNLDRICLERLEAQDKAAEVAGQALAERMSRELNERFVVRHEYLEERRGMCADIAELEKMVAQSVGKASQSSVMISWAIAGIALIISVIHLFK